MGETARGGVGVGVGVWVYFFLTCLRVELRMLHVTADQVPLFSLPALRRPTSRTVDVIHTVLVNKQLNPYQAQH